MKVTGTARESIDAHESRSDSVRTLNSIRVDGEPFASSQIMQNDIVALAGEWGTWRVVAPVNGSKADLRRTQGFDTRVVTAVLKNLTLIEAPAVQEAATERSLTKSHRENLFAIEDVTPRQP
jgi:hypothetical protein